jgi:hypothetical protein
MLANAAMLAKAAMLAIFSYDFSVKTFIPGLVIIAGYPVMKTE